jgi:hypothetical protein
LCCMIAVKEHQDGTNNISTAAAALPLLVLHMLVREKVLVPHLGPSQVSPRARTQARKVFAYTFATNQTLDAWFTQNIAHVRKRGRRVGRRRWARPVTAGFRPNHREWRSARRRRSIEGPQVCSSHCRPELTLLPFPNRAILSFR